jgi:hypothetical protein
MFVFVSGCGPTLPTQHHQRLLPPAALSLRRPQEHHPADEVRGAARARHPEQPQVEHLAVPDHSARGAQHIPGGPARHHRQQGEDPHLHASHQGQLAAGTGTINFSVAYSVPFDPWMGKKSGIRIQDEQPGSCFQELRNNFLGLNTFFDADPGSATLIISVPMLQIYILIRIQAFL